MRKKTKQSTYRRIIAFALVVTLAVSGLTPMRSVQAEQMPESDSEERLYVVYMNLPDEKEESPGTDEAHTSDAGTESEEKDVSVQTGENEGVSEFGSIEDEGISTFGNGEDEEFSQYGNIEDEDRTEEAACAVSGNHALQTDEDVTEGADSQAEDEPAEDEAVWQELQEAQQLLEESAESEELVKSDSAIVYEADLTEAELQTLEQSGAEIYVEENIELSGAGSKAKEKVKGSKEEEPKKSDAKKSDAKKSNAKKSDAKKTNIKKADTRKADTKKNDNKETDAQTAGNHTQDGNVCSGSGEEAQTETEWNIRMIHGDAGSEPSGEPVKVAIMDSGIELLSGIPVEGMVNLVKSEQDIPYYMNDMAGHGTSVADIVSDIAPDAQIYCVKVMDGNNRATLSSVIEGIYWCIDHDIDIINMSFGTDVESRVLHKAIQDAADAGILIVASAGNGNLAGVEYPAAFAEVIAVGAVDTSAQKTAESAVGEEVELAAPGEQILATSLLGLETVVSGTSMAAPHVTGAAAVLWQKDKMKRVDFIRGLLRESANDLGDENEYGSGLIDLQFALEHYDEYATAYEKRQAELSQAEEMQEEQTSEEQAQEAQKEQGAGEMQEEKGLSAIASIEEFDADVQLLEERNHTPIETHEEVAYVEGRWRQDGHEKLVKLANEKYGINFEGYIIEIFKKGMIAPDASDNTLKVSDDGNNNCWHGGALNYISNYRFATKIARCGGNAAQCKMARGQTEKKL